MVLDEPCPACGKDLDTDDPLIRDYAPEGGDVAICIGCRAVLVFVARRGALHREVASQAVVDALPPEVRSTMETVMGVLGRGKIGGTA